MTQRFTLWRGDTQIGWFDEHAPVRHHGKVSGVAGFLTRVTGAPAPDAIMQTTVPTFPGSPTFQNPIPPTPPSNTPRCSYVEQEIVPGPPGVDPTCPPERQYTVRSADGQPIVTRMIVLEEVAFPPGEGVKIGLPADATSVWRVIVSWDDDGSTADPSIAALPRDDMGTPSG